LRYARLCPFCRKARGKIGKLGNILYFHFDVIAFDHDFVTWNALLRWWPQNSAGFQVEIRIGRVIQAVEDMGKLDNTLIIYMCGDNGTSPEGKTVGTFNQYTAYNGILDIPIAAQMRAYDAWGSAGTYPHMAVAWSWAFDTPFKWTKQVASHFGGTRQGLCISWPGHIKDVGGIRTQFHHVIDIVPTILEKRRGQSRILSGITGDQRLAHRRRSGKSRYRNRGCSIP